MSTPTDIKKVKFVIFWPRKGQTWHPDHQTSLVAGRRISLYPYWLPDCIMSFFPDFSLVREPTRRNASRDQLSAAGQKVPPPQAALLPGCFLVAAALPPRGRRRLFRLVVGSGVVRGDRRVPADARPARRRRWVGQTLITFECYLQKINFHHVRMNKMHEGMKRNSRLVYYSISQPGKNYFSHICGPFDTSWILPDKAMIRLKLSIT